MLSKDGDVWCWGNGMYGQLGQGQLSSLAVPRLVLPGRNIVDAGAPQAGGSMVFFDPP